MLPKNFKPIFMDTSELIRVGPKSDGGYVLSKKLVETSKHLISFGICDNFDFEKNFQKLNNSSIDAYDHSIDNKYWVNHLKKNLVKLFSLKILTPKKLFNIFKYFEFLIFFKKNKNNFYLKKIGNEVDCLNFEQCLSNTINDDIFLNIDIEGSEYDFIDKINLFSDKITGFVIEFHDFNKNIKKIENFIIELKNFKIIHIHGNNYAKINSNGNPDVIEITFSNKKLLTNSLKKNNYIYPIKGFDFPNKKGSFFNRKNDTPLNFEV